MTNEFTFKDLNLSPKLLNILNDMEYQIPTPIQMLSFPILKSGKDVLGIAETGSGKTGAFSLPFIQKQIELKRKKMNILIIEPTQELATQTAALISEFTKFFPIFVHVCIKDKAPNLTSKELRKHPHYLVATPNALLTWLKKDSKIVGYSHILVLDEVDKLMEKKFFSTVKKILYYMPPKKQTVLFTSTINKNIERFTRQLLSKDYEKVVVDGGKNRFSKPAETIDQKIQYLKLESKLAFTKDFLNTEKPKSTIIFFRTQARAEKVFKKLKESDFSVAMIHGGKSASLRSFAMKLFKEGKAKILITTDIASRGIDIKDVSHVINYDMPNNPEIYVHRIGRTGRAGKSGTSISLIAEDDMMCLEKIQKLIRQKIPVITIKNWEQIVHKKKMIMPSKEKALQQHAKKREIRKIKSSSAKKNKPKEKVKIKKVHTQQEYKQWKLEKKLAKRNQKKKS
ncbi:MAG: DEAD/DEAH box helicase [Planctomycetota bacterium]|nr:MAG: DEAD/DEAH box helicase [Planctomycetota bacterium]